MALPEPQPHEEGLRAQLRERVISFPSMERRLRLISGFGVATLLASGVLLAVRDVPMSQVSIDYVDGHLTTMPSPSETAKHASWL